MIGARAWTQRAAGELARIPGRVRKADGELTDAERRIAELVAASASNKQVAATLFITVHTVEGALTRVYRKFDVRSRTELAVRFTSEPRHG